MTENRLGIEQVTDVYNNATQKGKKYIAFNSI